MESVHVFGEVAFLCETFVTYFTREGGRGGGHGVDGVGVVGEAAFACEPAVAD